MEKSLFEYDILVNDVFYRFWHILTWIEEHPDMSDLDKEAICATIMDALVYKGLIDPEKEFLNIDNLSITNNSNDYKYDKTPFVSSIPMELKEKFRTKSIVVSGSIPISIFLSKPAGGVRYCVYDPNTAVSSFFEDFRFIKVEYDSPTRNGARAKERPFVEVEINGELYLVDILTKRIFKSSEFAKRYNMIELDSVKKSDFDERKNEYYDEQVKESLALGSYLMLTMSIMKKFEDQPAFAELFYEIEKSKEYCPEGWRQYKEEMDHMSLMFSNKR